jgi:hypothetical protein
VNITPIECRGDHRQMGESQGRACADSLARMDDALLELAGLAGDGLIGRAGKLLKPIVSKGMSLVGTRLLERALRDHYPDQYARLEGIAAGSGVPLQKLFIGPAVELLLNQVVPARACTAVAITREGSANGEPIIAKNFDYPPAGIDLYRGRISRPAGLASSLEVTAAPLAGCHEGVNEYGLAVAYNYGHFSGKATARVAITTLVQELLERCDSVDEAIEVLESRPRDGGALLMLADGGGNIASVELGPDAVDVRRGRDSDGVLVHANHAVTETMQARDVPPDTRYPRWWRPASLAGTRFHESSERRHARAQALAADAAPLDEAGLRALLADHDGGEGSDTTICRHGPYYATTCSVLLFPRRRQIAVMFGSPCTSRFVTLSLGTNRGPNQSEKRIRAEVNPDRRFGKGGAQMASYSGTVKKNDLEGGFWELHTDDGDSYQLRGGDDSLRVEGQRVEISGTLDEGGSMGIGMTGPYLDVASWKAA